MNPEITERPINEETRSRYGVTAFPAVLFLSPDGGLIQKASGFLLPEQFSPIMESALEKEKIFMKQIAELDKMPEDAKLNAQVAITYLDRMQFEKALPISEKTFELDPKNGTGLIPNLHNQLGLAYAAKGETAGDAKEMATYYEKAILHFKTVVDEYPKSDLNQPAQYYLGVTYALGEDYDSAISVLDKLVNHTSDDMIKRNAEAMLTRIKQLAEAK